MDGEGISLVPITSTRGRSWEGLVEPREEIIVFIQSRTYQDRPIVVRGELIEPNLFLPTIVNEFAPKPFSSLARCNAA